MKTPTNDQEPTKLGQKSALGLVSAEIRAHFTDYVCFRRKEPCERLEGRSRPSLVSSPFSFVIVGEVGRRFRPPDIERVLRRVIVAIPVVVGRNKIDVGRIFAVAAPGIAHIMEVIGPEDMAAKTPTLRKAPIRHLHGASADSVDRSDLPTAMM
jgi:hypothetical protein